ncbi:MAG: FHA domain-containing protein [Vicinamibacterales bacterium]
MMARLRVHRGAAGVPDRVLGASTLIGRSRTADLHLPDRGVSSRHALVRVTDAGTFVIDLGSQNGTFVNQRRVVTPVRLQPGDMLRLGDVLLEFDAAVPEAPGPATISVPVAARSETQVLLAVPARGRPAPAGAVLDDLRRRLTESFDSATLLPFVAERLLDALPGAERVFVMRGTEADAMVLAAASVRSGSDGIAASRTLLRRALGQREGLIYSAVRTEGALAEAASVRVTAVRAVMCAPLTFDDRVLGVIQADTTASVAAFGEADLRLLMAVASQGGGDACLRGAARSASGRGSAGARSGARAPPAGAVPARTAARMRRPRLCRRLRAGPGGRRRLLRRAAARRRAPRRRHR